MNFVELCNVIIVWVGLGVSIVFYCFIVLKVFENFVLEVMLFNKLFIVFVDCKGKCVLMCVDFNVFFKGKEIMNN